MSFDPQVPPSGSHGGVSAHSWDFTAGKSGLKTLHRRHAAKEKYCPLLLSACVLHVPGEPLLTDAQLMYNLLSTP